MIFGLTLNYLLIPKLNNYGAAISTSIGMLILMVLSFIFSQKLFSIKYNFKVCFLQLMTCIIYFILTDFLNQNITIPSVICITIIFISTFNLKELQISMTK